MGPRKLRDMPHGVTPVLAAFDPVPPKPRVYQHHSCQQLPRMTRTLEAGSLGGERKRDNAVGSGSLGGLIVLSRCCGSCMSQPRQRLRVCELKLTLSTASSSNTRLLVQAGLGWFLSFTPHRVVETLKIEPAHKGLCLRSRCWSSAAQPAPPPTSRAPRHSTTPPPSPVEFPVKGHPLLLRAPERRHQRSCRHPFHPLEHLSLLRSFGGGSRIFLSRCSPVNFPDTAVFWATGGFSARVAGGKCAAFPPPEVLVLGVRSRGR